MALGALGALARGAAVVVVATCALTAFAVSARGNAGASDATATANVGGIHCLAPMHPPTSAAAPSYRGTDGAVSVTVPRFTYVETTGSGWTVRTNTEAPPSPRDQFAVIAGGRASVASADVVRTVLAACG